jgi:hypothetical protein
MNLDKDDPTPIHYPIDIGADSHDFANLESKTLMVVDDADLLVFIEHPMLFVCSQSSLFGVGLSGCQLILL